MVIGASQIELHLHGVRSLKEKRSVVKSLIAQVSRKFNAAVAEVDLHDVWQSASIGVAVVSTSPDHAETMLENIAEWIAETRPDVDVVGQTLETLTL